MRLIQSLVAVLFLAMIGGCATEMSPRGNAGQVQHIVVCWLKPGGDREAVLHTGNDFAKLRGVQDVSAGYKLASDQPMVDSTYDVALVVTFDSEASLRTAEKSETIRNVIDGPFKANVTKTVVYDSFLQNYQVGQVFAEENEAATRQRRAAAIEQQQETIQRTR